MPLILDHIDGNPNNWALENIRLICPNCDGLTPTYKNRNRGHRRHVSKTGTILPTHPVGKKSKESGPDKERVVEPPDPPDELAGLEKRLEQLKQELDQQLQQVADSQQAG